MIERPGGSFQPFGALRDHRLAPRTSVSLRISLKCSCPCHSPRLPDSATLPPPLDSFSSSPAALPATTPGIYVLSFHDDSRALLATWGTRRGEAPVVSPKPGFTPERIPIWCEPLSHRQWCDAVSSHVIPHPWSVRTFR